MILKLAENRVVENDDNFLSIMYKQSNACALLIRPTQTKRINKYKVIIIFYDFIFCQLQDHYKL